MANRKVWSLVAMVLVMLALSASVCFIRPSVKARLRPPVVVGPDEPFDGPLAAHLRERGWGADPDVEGRVLDLLARTDAALGRAGVEYVVIGAAVEGHCRHGGLVPWSDDAVELLVHRRDAGKLYDALNMPAEGEEAEQGTPFLADALQVVPCAQPGPHLKVSFSASPRSVGDLSLGFPFLTVLLYDINDAGILSYNSSSSPSSLIELPADALLPPARTSFASLNTGISVPRDAGRYLDLVQPDWRWWCVIDDLGQRSAAAARKGEATVDTRGSVADKERDSRRGGGVRVQGRCTDLARLVGHGLAPMTAMMRCPSASMYASTATAATSRS